MLNPHSTEAKEDQKTFDDAYGSAYKEALGIMCESPEKALEFVLDYMGDDIQGEIWQLLARVEKKQIGEFEAAIFTKKFFRDFLNIYATAKAEDAETPGREYEKEEE